ncbi:hypothetical protein CPC08DRAFT_712103 [Agrocybe pediades]|nr:hypothetical protein CPC08DRAFT_712103 [Agrocybe pediades]
MLSVDILASKTLFGVCIAITACLAGLFIKRKLRKWRITRMVRAEYYSWFINNEAFMEDWKFAGDSRITHRAIDEILLTGWSYTKGEKHPSSSFSVAKMMEDIARFSFSEKECHMFCSAILAGLFPDPDRRNWITFGFCICNGKANEIALLAAYQKLLLSCTFAEFLLAYETCTLAELFKSKGVDITKFSYLEGVLAGSPYVNDSVWDLKQWILVGKKRHVSHIHSSVFVDYGFMNCRNADELHHLIEVYRAYFERDDVNPTALHEACIRGKLAEHVNQFVKTNRGKRYKKLMKNLYPLDPKFYTY